MAVGLANQLGREISKMGLGGDSIFIMSHPG